MNFSIQNTKYNFKGDPDYVVNKSYSIMWSHSSDSRARPGTTFSANVNAGSTTYNQYIPNNVNKNFQNQLGSSITYAKTFKNSNLTVSANHNQNNQSSFDQFKFAGYWLYGKYSLSISKKGSYRYTKMV